jgi:hypothetical protein
LGDRLVKESGEVETLELGEPSAESHFGVHLILDNVVEPYSTYLAVTTTYISETIKEPDARMDRVDGGVMKDHVIDHIVLGLEGSGCAEKWWVL